MTPTLTSRPLRRLRRALLIADGSDAQAVAARVLDLSRECMSAEPPFVLVDGAETARAGLGERSEEDDALSEDGDQPDTSASGSGTLDAFVAALIEACDHLTGAAMITALRAAGWSLARPDEIELWLIVDLAHGWEERTARYDDWLPSFMRMAWRRLRMHITAQALLLAGPEGQHSARTCAGRLLAAGVEQIYLAGPIDEDRLRWQAGEWQERAAMALAALLWRDGVSGAGDLGLPSSLASSLANSRATCPSVAGSQASSGEIQERAASGDAPIDDMMAWGIGGAGRPSPLPRFKRKVVLLGAMIALKRMTGEDAGAPVRPTPDDSPNGAPGSVAADLSTLASGGLTQLAVTPDRHRLAVNSVVPPEPPTQVWGRRRPGWAELAALTAELKETAAKSSAEAHDAQYGPRGEWIAGQVAAWEDGMGHLRDDCLAPVTGWPQYEAYRRELNALDDRLKAACVVIEDWLEDAGTCYAQAETATRNNDRARNDLCAAFPAPSRAGVLGLLLRPWRWPFLAWAYLVLLPRYVQRYLDAVHGQGQARRNEANLHALRQAYLAMTQVVRERQHEAGRFHSALTAALAVLNETAQGAEDGTATEGGGAGDLWTAEQLEALARSMLPADGPNLLPALTRLSKSAAAAPSLLDGDERDPVGGDRANAEALMAEVLAWSGQQMHAMDHWTAADCVASVLSDERLAGWVGEMTEHARPLWPGVDSQAESVAWLLCPVRDRHDVETGSESEDRLQMALGAWAGLHEPQMLRAALGACAADTLFMFRATAVDLADDD
jgi:hypothetical protein